MKYKNISTNSTDVEFLNERVKSLLSMIAYLVDKDGKDCYSEVVIPYSFEKDLENQVMEMQMLPEGMTIKVSGGKK